MRYIVTITKTAEIEVVAKDEVEASMFAAALESQALIQTSLAFNVQPLAEG